MVGLNFWIIRKKFWYILYIILLYYIYYIILILLIHTIIHIIFTYNLYVTYYKMYVYVYTILFNVCKHDVIDKYHYSYLVYSSITRISHFMDFLNDNKILFKSMKKWIFYKLIYYIYDH